jgi:hypothetical protein
MKCPKCVLCKQEMIISEWDGWVWMCPVCDYEGESATDIEVEEWEEEMYASKNRTPTI